MNARTIRVRTLCVASLLIAGAVASVQGPAAGTTTVGGPGGRHANPNKQGVTMEIKYLEIVTPAVDETCTALAAAHGVVFGDPVAELGNARTAELHGGGRIGVRAPMRETEDPVVRPYLLVNDINASVKAAQDAGATVAIPPMEIPGQGTFAIYVLGGIEHGLWQR